jgi:serine/threonine protein kinase
MSFSEFTPIESPRSISSSVLSSPSGNTNTFSKLLEAFYNGRKITPELSIEDHDLAELSPNNPVELTHSIILKVIKDFNLNGLANVEKKEELAAATELLTLTQNRIEKSNVFNKSIIQLANKTLKRMERYGSRNNYTRSVPLKPTKADAKEARKRLHKASRLLSSKLVVSTAEKKQSPVRRLFALPPPSPTPTTEEQSTISSQFQKLKAIIIGQKVRKHIILPKQILPALRSQFPRNIFSEEDLTKLAKIISRESIQLFQELVVRNGRAKTISAKIPYSFSIPANVTFDEATGMYKKIHKLAPARNTLIHLPCDIQITMQEHKNRLRVQLLPSSKYMIRESKGAYKTLFHSTKLYISLAKPELSIHSLKLRSITYSPYLIFRPNTHLEQEDIQKVRKGYIQHQNAFDAAQNEASLPFSPYTRISVAPRLLSSTLNEWEQPLYNGDLNDAVELGRVPIEPQNQESSETKELRFSDKLNIARNLISTLAFLHERGQVHHDVKPKNILLKVDKSSEQIEGYLTDFDFSETADHRYLSSSYHYWDTLGNLGYYTKEGDIYGYAMTLGETFFPNFFLTFSRHPEAILDETNYNNYLSEALWNTVQQVIPSLVKQDFLSIYKKALQKSSQENLMKNLLDDPNLTFLSIEIKEDLLKKFKTQQKILQTIRRVIAADQQRKPHLDISRFLFETLLPKLPEEIRSNIEAIARQQASDTKGLLNFTLTLLAGHPDIKDQLSKEDGCSILSGLLSRKLEHNHAALETLRTDTATYGDFPTATDLFDSIHTICATHDLG